VVALKNDKMRGQAFIVFKDLQTSTAALRKEDGRVFAGKAMKISYAQSKSYATIEHESGKEALYQYRMGIIKNPEGSKKLTVSGAERALGAINSKRDRAGENGGEEDDDDETSAAKRARTDDAEEEEEDMQVESDDE